MHVRRAVKSLPSPYPSLPLPTHDHLAAILFQLRSLPCGHAFHAGCITPWLTQRQRTCPMCKDPVTLGASPTRSAPAAVAPSSSTPSAEEADFITPTSTGGDQHSGATGEGRGGGSSAADGDRLPLLSNSRGSPSAGGSIQDTSPV